MMGEILLSMLIYKMEPSPDFNRKVGGPGSGAYGTMVGAVRGGEPAPAPEPEVNPDMEAFLNKERSRPAVQLENALEYCEGHGIVLSEPGLEALVAYQMVKGDAVQAMNIAAIDGIPNLPNEDKEKLKTQAIERERDRERESLVEGSGGGSRKSKRKNNRRTKRRRTNKRRIRKSNRRSKRRIRRSNRKTNRRRIRRTRRIRKTRR